MATLDHIIFASWDVDDGIAHIAELTGVTPALGGPHIGLGTHNALMSLGGDVYFEIIGRDPNQPDATGPFPFGLTESSPSGLAGYAAHPSPGQTIEEVADSLRAANLDPGPVRSMSRRKPDGEELSWSLTRSTPASTLGGGLPFLIEWGGPNPAGSTTPGCTLVELQVSHPDPAAVQGGLSAIGVEVTLNEGPFALKAIVDSPKGQVEIG